MRSSATMIRPRSTNNNVRGSWRWHKTFHGYGKIQIHRTGNESGWVRLLLEDVTLIQNAQITAHIRFKGGITNTLVLPRPLNSWEGRTTPAAVVNEIDHLLDHYTELEIAGILNERGVRSGDAKAFNSRAVARVRSKYQLKSRYDRLRDKGMLTLEEMADRLQLTPICVRAWRDHGLLKAYPVSDRNIWLYEDPGPDPPRKAQGIKLSERRRFPENITPGSQEVQYEA